MKPLPFLLALTLAPTLSFAQLAISLSAGYSDIQFTHAAHNLDYDHGGGYFDADLSLLLPTKPRLLVGLGVDASYHHESLDLNSDRFVLFGNASDVGLYSFEARVGLPISPPNAQGFFLLPRLGAGILTTHYAIDTPDSTQTHTASAFELRPTLQAGFARNHFSAGLELSYLTAWGSFGHLGSRARDAHIGAFLRFRF